MKKILALCLAVCLIEVSLSAATVAYYKFNGSGVAPVGTPINDLAGSSHGAVAGGDLVYGVDSLVGGYLAFEADGGDRVVIPHTPALVFNTDGAYTMEAIFRTTQSGSTVLGALFSKGADVGNPDTQYWMRRQDTGAIRGLIEGSNGTEDSATSSNTASDGAWHHVALVFDGTTSPKRLQIYIDGVLRGSDASVGTVGSVGGGDADPLVIGELASLSSARSFAGDIAALRFSDAALSPQDFLRTGLTYISDMTPTNNASFLPTGTIPSFRVQSSIGVPSTGIQVLLNHADVTSQAVITGSQADWFVTLPALQGNTLYPLQVLVTDLAGNNISGTTTFDTFNTGLRFVEGEDYNFENGQYIDNPQLSSAPGAQNYLDRLGVEGVDYHQTNTPPKAIYRIGDQVGTDLSQDVLRQEYADAQLSDPGVADYVANAFGNTEWLNYTRTFPDDNYRVYARVARAGTAPIIMSLDEVTAGSTTSSQTLLPIGLFKGMPTGSANAYAFVPLLDAMGNELSVHLSGARTLRLTMLTGAPGLNLNYLLFVPVGSAMPPFLSSISPAYGADNELSNLSIQASIRNTTRLVDTATILLKLDATTVTPAIVATPNGADVSYTPPPLSTGLHTVTLIYRDSGLAWTTNQWSFRVAIQEVLGFWRFDEKAPGNLASTAPGAILDSSGNQRNGTSTQVPPRYISGSLYYGNTSALQFNSGMDRVVVPDPNGTFNFTGSFTFEAVVRTTNTTAGAALLAKNGTDGEGEYWWRLPGSGGLAQQIAMGGKFLTGTNKVNDGAWHHIAVVYDATAGEIRLYFDYQVEATTLATFTSPAGRPNDLTIGSFLNGGSEFLGDIDFIRISSSALEPVAFVQPSSPMEPIVTATRPVNQATVVAPTARIEADLMNRDTTLVNSSVKLFLDGANVTSSVQVSPADNGATVSYTPTAPFAGGSHTAQLTYQDSINRSYTNTWTFDVTLTVTVIGEYHFDEKQPGQLADTTPGAIVDSSGNARHGTAVVPGTPGISYVAGSPVYGGTSALEFIAATSNYVAVADASGAYNFGPTQSITFEAILKTVTIGTASVGSIVAKQAAGQPEYYWRIDANGKQRLAMNDGNGLKSLVGNTVLNDGQWHHIAAVYDGVAKQIRLYVDSVLDGSVNVVFGSDTTVIGSSEDLWIGQFQNYTRQFEGEIDALKATAAAIDPSWFIPMGGPAAAVVIDNVVVQNSNIQFGFNTQSGKSYTVESSTSLSAWTDVETVQGDGSRKNFTYPFETGPKFYRVRIQ